MRYLLTALAAGFAPRWLTALVWLTISGTAVLLWRAIREQDRREQRRRARRYGDHERRLHRIKHHLFHNTHEDDGTEHNNETHHPRRSAHR